MEEGVKVSLQRSKSAWIEEELFFLVIVKSLRCAHIPVRGKDNLEIRERERAVDESQSGWAGKEISFTYYLSNSRSLSQCVIRRLLSAFRPMILFIW